MGQSKFSTKSLNHLGLLSGVIKKVKLVDRIDKMIPVPTDKGAIVTMGERVAAMIYDALSFVDTRLYMFPQFLSQKPVKRILGQHLSAESFTHDALGRCLDEIHSYRTTKFVSDIIFSIA